MSPRRRLLVLAALALVASCGFRLEGQSSWPPEWRGYQLENQLRGIEGEDFAGALQLRLEQSGVERDAKPAATIRLISLSQRKIVSALDARGQAAEYELQRRVEFRVRAGGRQSPTFSVIAQRRLSFDPSLALAKQQEEAQIVSALTRELTELLVLRVEAELRGISATASPPPAEEGV